MHARVWQTRDSEGVATWRESKYQAQAGADSVVACSLRAVMVSRRGGAKDMFGAFFSFSLASGISHACNGAAQCDVTASQNAKTDDAVPEPENSRGGSGVGQKRISAIRPCRSNPPDPPELLKHDQ
jgi:hypothetical protein